MLRHLIATLLVSLFVSNVASADLLIKDGDKLEFLGDSITEFGWNSPGGYVKLTVAGLGLLGVKVEPIPAGISGQTSRDMLARFADVLAKKPNWLTISCGVNDVWHGPNGCPLDEYQKNITSMVDQAQAAGIKVLLMTSTPIGEDDNVFNKKLVAYNDFLHQFAAERHLPIADENAAFQAILKDNKAPLPVLTVDGVHPNPDGAQAMATALLAGFGASPAQLDQVNQRLADMPSSAWAHAAFGFSIDPGITINQYKKLKLVAADRKIHLRDLLGNIFLQSLSSAIQAHSTDAYIDAGIMQQEAQKAFVEKVAELTK